MYNDVKINGTDETFSVNNIYCIGKNYLEHIKELDKDFKIPEEPVVFTKPNSALVSDSGVISVPVYNGQKISKSLQNEVEFVVAIGKDGCDIPESSAANYILGYAVGLDMTLRDRQSEFKKKGLPWALSKGFRTSCPISEIIKKEIIHNPMDLDINLAINNSIIQSTNTGLMLFNIYKLISFISTIFSLKKGDLIFTGTPEGVTDIKSGDILTASLSGYIKLTVKAE